MALQFETKKVPNTSKDVLVTIANSDKKNGKEQDVLRIRFANDTAKLISESDYLIMAATDTRIYFAESDRINGWKLHPREDNEQYTAISCKSPVLVGWAIHGGIGEYDLQFDQKEHLYFIEKEVLKFQQRIR